MDYLIIFSTSILANLKVGVQTAFSRKNVKNSTDALAFNFFVFASAALLFVYDVFGCSPLVWVYAFAGAIATVVYQIFYTKALVAGNVSLTVLITNFSMVINVLISRLFFGDRLTPMRLLGIVLTAVAFVICTGVQKSGGVSKKWLFYSLIAMFSSSLGTMVIKFMSVSECGGEGNAFVSCLYILAAGIGLIIYPVMNKNTPRSFRINFNMIKYAFGVGFFLALYQVINTYAITNIDGTFLFPVQTGGTIICSALSGLLIFKDNITIKQIFGIALGIISLVLMNF